MRSVCEKAYGKLNLTLDVLGTRPDGYHEMCMLMQSVELYDLVTVELSGNGWQCRCDVPGVPADASNLALRAAEAFFGAYGSRPVNLTVSIRKQIPMQGGMAGGSADAAAVLRGLNTLFGSPYDVQKLCRLGEGVGSDVPYCVLGGTVLARGRGELLTPLPPMPQAWFCLVKPEFSVSTPQLFRRLDDCGISMRPDTEKALDCLRRGDLPGLCGCMQNVFQPVLEQQYPVIGTICCRLQELGALGACLTGTGSVVFGVFDEEHAARRACETFRLGDMEAFAVKSV